MLVDAEVAGVHVGLGEHEAIITYLDGRQLLLGQRREQCVRLAQISCWRTADAREYKSTDAPCACTVVGPRRLRKSEVPCNL